MDHGSNTPRERGIRVKSVTLIRMCEDKRKAPGFPVLFVYPMTVMAVVGFPYELAHSRMYPDRGSLVVVSGKWFLLKVFPLHVQRRWRVAVHEFQQLERVIGYIDQV